MYKLNTKFCCGGGIVKQFIGISDKMFLPEILQQYVVNGHKTYLLYPIIDRTETTIGQHYYYPN